MAVHASHAALPYPIKGARYSIAVPLLDADGDPTAQTTPDTEISKDNGSAADAAEEVSATSGMDGMGLITFTGAETDCSVFAAAFKATSGPKTTLGTFYPRVLPVLFSGTAQAGAAGTITVATDVPAVASLLFGCIVKTTGGTGGGGTGGANNQARVITGFSTGRVATVTPNWETAPDNTTTYEVLLTEVSLMRYSDLQLWRGSQPNAIVAGRVEVLLGAVTAGVIAAASFASNALDAVWSTATRVLTAATNITSTGGTTVPQTGDAYARLGAPVGASTAGDIADVKTVADAIKVVTDELPDGGALTSLGAEPAEIADAVMDEALSGHAIAGTAGKAISDSLARLSTVATKTGAVVADGGNSATSFVTDLTDTTTDYWKDCFLKITNGVLINQVKRITAYNGTTKAVTVLGGFTGTPAAGVTFEVIND